MFNLNKINSYLAYQVLNFLLTINLTQAISFMINYETN